MTPITRRTTLRLGIPLTAAVVGANTALAEPLDGKGNDVCPCIFGVDTAVLNEDGTIDVSGPCEVETPPEDVVVHVQVRGDRGARAIGSTSFVCEADDDGFAVSATTRGVDRFQEGETVDVHASVRIDADDAPAVTGRWSWTGRLS